MTLSVAGAEIDSEGQDCMIMLGPPVEVCTDRVDEGSVIGEGIAMELVPVVWMVASD